MRKGDWIALAAACVMLLSGAGKSDTLVIDAGHGGFDGGAVSADGLCEQDINLSIARRIEALAGFFGVQSVLTRPDEQALDYQPGRSVHDNKVADLHARERIAAETANAVFLSIHLNKFEQSIYHGAQVFYSPNDPDSKPLAEALQAALIEGLDPTNHRQARRAAGTIYLMKRLRCPAVVIECGFLSNPEETRLLRQEDYHKRIAVCVLSGYLRDQGARNEAENHLSLQ